MNGGPALVSLALAVASPAFAFLPSASLAFASQMSFLVISPTASGLGGATSRCLRPRVRNSR